MRKNVAVIVCAFLVDNEEDAERVLFSYGFGTSIPTNSKRRARQSVQLARRVLKLERVNASLRQQLEGGERERNGLKEKVRTLCEQLELSEKPQNYLLEVLKKRDDSLKNATNKSDILEKKNKYGGDLISFVVLLKTLSET
jgi:progesterone-induced-blocking factor 1